MRMIHFKHLASIVFVAIALTSVACEESSSSENEVQKSINSLLFDLQVATSGSNTDGLETVISAANKIRPSTQSQTQSKNLLLSTAREKLAQLKFQLLSTETAAAIPLFNAVVAQSIQVDLLRSAANSLSEASANVHSLRSQEIAAAQASKKVRFNAQLDTANSAVSTLESQRNESRDRAHSLREEAEQLLNDSENEGIVEGHKTYKSGVKTLRESQRENLRAATIELQSTMSAEPMRTEAQDELEAIASILNGMQYTEKLLHQLRDTTIQNAADFRELADDIDAQTASAMNEAIAKSTSLKQQWESLSILIQDAMKGSGNRTASREAQQTASIWKLDLEWTLGQVEEAKRSFLLEEARAVHALIEHGIATSSDSWREHAASLTAAIEQATITALSAYENAKQLASNVGAQGDTFIHQLDTRIAILQGAAIPTPLQTTQSTGQPISPSGVGFATPQALVIAFNSATDIRSFDGTAPVANIRNFYQLEDATAESLITFMNNTLQSTGNLLLAIRNNIGADAVAQFKAMSPTQSSSVVMQIDPTSVVLVNDENATAREVSGRSVKLLLTTQGWKISLSSRGDPEAAMAFSMISEMMAPILQIADSITQQINDGQLTSVEQINAAMMSEMENMNPF